MLHPNIASPRESDAVGPRFAPANLIQLRFLAVARWGTKELPPRETFVNERAQWHEQYAFARNTPQVCFESAAPNSPLKFSIKWGVSELAQTDNHAASVRRLLAAEDPKAV